MSNTPNLALPQIAAAQAMKHVTHNEALATLDALVQLAVVSRASLGPPAVLVEGSRYLVPLAATGSFAGRTGQIALYDAGIWRFLPPKTGWLAYVADEAVALIYSGTAWVALGQAVGSIDQLASLGIGTSADATNRLAVRSAGALFTAPRLAGGGTGDMRLLLEKESAARTGSLLFQTNYSGRAEIGLAGDDDVRLKVSPNGTSWLEAIRVDRTSGVVSFPQGTSGAMTAAVAGPVGAMSNIGLAATIAGGTLTISLTDAAGATPTVGSAASIPFRAAAPASGMQTQRSVAAANSLTVPSGAVLGAGDANVAFNLYVVAFDDGAGVRLGIINCRSGDNLFALGAFPLASAVALSAASASAHVMYCAGGMLTSRPFTVLGRLVWPAGLATPGTWVLPGRIELVQPGFRMPGDTIQLVSVKKTDSFGSASTSFVDVPGLALSLTLTSPANLVRLDAQFMLGAVDESIFAGVRLVRNGTPIAVGDAAGNRIQGNYGGSSPYLMDNTPILWLDAPNSSAALVYKAQLISTSTTIYINRSYDDSNTGFRARAASMIMAAELQC